MYDTQTKLVRFGARDYDSYTGRWTAKDPIGFNGGVSNFYEYCLNDPVNYVDFIGLQRWPGAGRVGSGFGYRTRPYSGFHSAIDISNSLGGNVLSSDNGTISRIWKDNTHGGGNSILIKNDDGTTSGYAHTKCDPDLRIGDKVYEGQRIGVTDMSGRTTGPHVHYTFRDKSGRKINPLLHLPKDNNYYYDREADWYFEGVKLWKKYSGEDRP